MSVAPSGKAGAPDDERILAALGKYVSRITARSLLESARRDVQQGELNGAEGGYKRLVEKLTTGIKLFTHNVLAPALTSELLSLQVTPETGSGPIQISVKRESDIAHLREAARKLCTDLGVRQMTLQKVATIVSELSRNMLSYASGGQMELTVEGSERRSIVIRATDAGAGIANLAEILGGKYRSRTGLGLGILGVKRLATDFRIDTGPRGTTIEARVAL